MSAFSIHRVNEIGPISRNAHRRARVDLRYPAFCRTPVGRTRLTRPTTAPSGACRIRNGKVSCGSQIRERRQLLCIPHRRFQRCRLRSLTPSFPGFMKIINTIRRKCCVRIASSLCSRTVDILTTLSVRHSTLPLLLFLLPLLSSTSHANQIDYTTCDVFADQCPFAFDEECDNGFFYSPLCEAGGDCFDCDPCQQFNFDCQACTEAKGCGWCPGDAFCSSAALTQFDMFLLYEYTTCPRRQDWQTDTSVCQKSPDAVYSDPLYAVNQWVYDMINVEPVWRSGITGKGVRVRINDNGADLQHPDLSKHADFQNSCLDNAPDPDVSGYEHGTTVASIVGASHDNDSCAVGIAPDAILSSCDVLSNTQRFDYRADAIDVSQNSWGRSGCSFPRDRIRRRHRQRRWLEKHVFGNGHRRRKLQLGDSATNNDSTSTFDDTESCPFLQDSRPCEACDFRSYYSDLTAELSTACTNTIANYCLRRSVVAVERDACLEFLEFFAECEYVDLPKSIELKMADGVRNGRDGKGIVYIFASGNDFTFGADVNYEGYVNTRYTICVGAIGRDGLHSSYSTPGAAMFVSAPGGEDGEVTTMVVANPGGGCANSGIGTSFACPVISGIVALLLEANPELGWRDVQGILALSAQIVEDLDDDTAIINAAGFWHSNWYGFGIPDTLVAVELAKDWVTYEPEELVDVDSGEVNIIINDNSNEEVRLSMIVEAPSDDFVAESVVVELDLEHASRGDLTITLVSPQGTASVIHPGQRPENTQLSDGQVLTLMTVRNWGEPIDGRWQLLVVDDLRGDLSDCVDMAVLLFLPDRDTIDCAELEYTTPQVCEGGAVQSRLVDDVQASDGTLAREACCICGGGVDSDSIVDRLVSWRLKIYGRNDSNGGAKVTEQPSLTPSESTFSPTQSSPPSSVPSIPPTDHPSVGPSQHPSGSPTTSSEPTMSSPPSTTPSASPTQYPTETASDTPSLFPTEERSMEPSMLPSTGPSIKSNLNGDFGASDKLVIPVEGADTTPEELQESPSEWVVIDGEANSLDEELADSSGAINCRVCRTLQALVVIIGMTVAAFPIYPA